MSVFKMPSLIIAEGASESNIIGGNLFDLLSSLLIMSPSSISGVVTVEVADTEPGDAVSGDFRDLQKDGADITIPADSAVAISPVNFRSLRIKTSVAPGVGGETHEVMGEDQPVAAI